MWGTIKAMIFNTYANPEAARKVEAMKDQPRGPLARLVQLGYAPDVKSKAGAA